MAVPLSRSSSQPDLQNHIQMLLPLLRAMLTSISLSFLLVALLLYSFNVEQLERSQLLLLAALLPALITPIVSWRHAKRTALIEHMQEEISLASRQDDLTGLWSRRFFYETAHRELQLAARHNYPVSLLLLRLENLTAINQSLGRLIGDYALRNCADKLKVALRETDILARFSEDTLVLLMPHSSLDQAEEVAQRLHKTLSTQPIKVKKESIDIQVSAGISSSTDSYHLQSLIDTAEQALHLSKEKANITALRVIASGA